MGERERAPNTNFTINSYQGRKTLALKGTQKSEENLNYRKESLFNEKLELIKISKYTHTRKHSSTMY